MTPTQIIIATVVWLVLTAAVYTHSNWDRIRDCYAMWFRRSYWTDYNTIEFLSWLAKVFIIVPGLIFGLQIWWFYFITLFTSLTLIWASNKKLLPTLVGFNTVWAWISCMVLAQHLI
jgi:small-conductance mechanosensitive channel